MGLGAYDHGTFRSPNTPSPTFKRSKDSSIYPLFFHILAHSFAHFRTHAKLNPFVFKQFRTLCAIHEGDGDGPDGRPGRDLLDEVLHGSPKAQAAVSRQPRQLPQSDRRDGNPALFV
jgi:hypothetical protein